MSYVNEVKLLLVWAFLAEMLAVALTIAVLIRKPPPLTTQVDKTTGIKHHGLLWWLLAFSAACTCMPVFLLVLRTLTAAWSLGTPLVSEYGWIAPVLLAVAALGFGGWWLWKRERAEVVQPVRPVEAPAQPVVGWSLPADAKHWEAR